MTTKFYKSSNKYFKSICFSQTSNFLQETISSLPHVTQYDFDWFLSSHARSSLITTDLGRAIISLIPFFLRGLLGHIWCSDLSHWLLDLCTVNQSWWGSYRALGIEPRSAMFKISYQFYLIILILQSILYAGCLYCIYIMSICKLYLH